MSLWQPCRSQGLVWCGSHHRDGSLSKVEKGAVCAACRVFSQYLARSIVTVTTHGTCSSSRLHPRASSTLVGPQRELVRTLGGRPRIVASAKGLFNRCRRLIVLSII